MKRITLFPAALKAEPAAQHVFIKGYRGRLLFHEAADYIVYLAFLKQFVRLQQALDRHSPSSQAVQVHGYSLQPRTVQLLVTDEPISQELTKLMRAIHIAYCRYYAKKYHYQGTLFTDVYKSTTIANNRDKQVLVTAMHVTPGNHWYQDSRIFYQSSHQHSWISPLKAQIIPKTPQNKISHIVAVDKLAATFANRR